MPPEPYRVLLIEDDAAHRYIYRRYLSEDAAPYEVFDAGTVSEGLAACERVEPHCIVVDFRLPDGDGLALLRRLRGVSTAPVIFITADPEPLTMTKAYREGAVRYLSKDFLSSETFQAAVAEALQR